MFSLYTSHLNQFKVKNSLFFSTLTFFWKLIIFQKTFSRKLFHFLVFGNNLEDKLNNMNIYFFAWYKIELFSEKKKGKKPLKIKSWVFYWSIFFMQLNTRKWEKIFSHKAFYWNKQRSSYLGTMEEFEFLQ